MGNTIKMQSLWRIVILFLTSGFCACLSQEAKRLALSMLQVTATSADIHLEELDGGIIQTCTLSHAIGSDTTKLEVLTNLVPDNNTLFMSNLNPGTEYDVTIVCHDNIHNTTASGTISFCSEYDNNTPGRGNCTIASSTTGRLPAAASTVAPGSHRTPVVPTLFVTDVAHTKMPPRDIWLGVAVGLLGVGGFICGGYYVLKEYRRRMRIRRFLQYRQQENETFPDMDLDEDEGIVM